MYRCLFQSCLVSYLRHLLDARRRIRIRRRPHQHYDYRVPEQPLTADHLAQPDTAPRIPVWLKIGAAVMIAEYLALFFTKSFNAVGAIGIGVRFLVVWLLLRRSRIAWGLQLLGAVSEITVVFSASHPLWPAVTSVIVAGCLLMPTSRTYVWSKKPRRKYSGWRVGGWLGRLFGFSAELEGEAQRKAPRFRTIVWILVIWVVVLLPLVGTLEKFNNGSARGSEVVDVLWHVAWVGWNLGLLALVAMLFFSYRAGKRGVQAR